MENAIIIGILLVVIVLALLRAKKHFKGGCCGSGNKVIRTKKELKEPKLGEFSLTVEGMHCENCQARIENVLNNIDGVACTVDLKKKTAIVSYSRDISADELKNRVEKLGYKVTSIR